MEIAICDDNELFLEGIKEQLKTLSMVDNIFMFSNLDTFLLSIDRGRRYDAVLMDIEWHDKVAGIDAAAEVYKLCPEAKIIFVTGSVEKHYQQVFLQRSNLSGYLTKPVNIELLRANLQKVADALPFGTQPSLVVRQQGATVSIPLREIYFIESQGRIVQIHTAGETVEAYDQLENILSSLPAGFYQCHRSYIVNMSHIRRFYTSDVLLGNGKRVPVSRLKYSETKKAYLSFMGRMF